jgi:uncharacterized membrane protein YraQ (UPF0718 family)/copper chaperone CopZ
METVRTYVGEFVGLVNEMSPYLLLGFFFAGFLRVVFPRKLITRYMGGSNLSSALNASLLGVPMPLCSCGVIPTGIGFYRNGASRGSTISFLISTPQTGVDSILATYAMLGLPFALIRPVVALFTGVLGGIFGNLADRKEGRSEAVKQEDEPQERSFQEFFRYGFVELIQDISKWLIIGMLVAALLAVLIPEDFFSSGISSEYFAMLLMLAASVPLYICATGSIPIAAVLLMKGLSPGAALVLLMAGPATNFATMAVIGSTMGKRSLWIYLASIIGGALLFGTLVNEVVPRQWILSSLPALTGHAMHQHPASWFQWLSSALLVGLIVNGYVQKGIRRKVLRREAEKKRERMTNEIHTFRVEGMTCNHCKANVEKGLGSLEGVKEAMADPERNLVTIEGQGLSENTVAETVEGLGYSFKGRVFRL